MWAKALSRFVLFEEHRPILAITVVVRWMLLAVFISMNNYRVDHDSTWLTLNLLALGLAALNAQMTWRLWRRRLLVWAHAQVISVADLAVITTVLYLHLGFQNGFYAFYYPALLGFSLLVPRRLSFAMVAVVGGVYTFIAFTVTPTLNTDLEQEKLLVVRLLTMVGMVVGGTLINSWERDRRLEAVKAEREMTERAVELERTATQAELELAEERNRISRVTHDVIANSAYGLNLGLENCLSLVQKDNSELRRLLETLQTYSELMLWELRYVINLAPLFEGRSLGQIVGTHLETYRTLASLPARLTVTGSEQDLPATTKQKLFYVAHNALTNALQHARPTEVSVELTYHGETLNLRVGDDGKGFEANKARSLEGQGLRNMRYVVEEELGGTFDVSSSPGNGTTVTVTLLLGEA